MGEKRVSQSTFIAFQGENDYHARIHLGTFPVEITLWSLPTWFMSCCGQVSNERENSSTFDVTITWSRLTKWFLRRKVNTRIFPNSTPLWTQFQTKICWKETGKIEKYLDEYFVCITYYVLPDLIGFINFLHSIGKKSTKVNFSPRYIM